jgi:hypothetical protein
MTFEEIIESSFTDLPICQNEEQSFREILKNRINKFGYEIDSSQNLCDLQGFNAEHFKKRNKILRDGLIQTVEAYYEGNPCKAYSIFEKCLKHSNILGYIDKNSRITSENNFFRIRIKNGNYALSKKELFHIPFDKRGLVRTQRYSIPSLPSLYLSNSIYTAWEEMGRPSFEDIQAVRISNVSSLGVLDLTTDFYNNNLYRIINHKWAYLYKVMVWPLVAACSIKVRNINDDFKPEYIIPQILLQWINAKSDLDGIKYSSTHIDNTNNHQGLFYNYVFPVKTYHKDEGYCPRLVSKFHSTEVLPIQLRQFVSHNSRFDEQESISFDVNKDVRSLELIKGISQHYSSSYFGILEHSLKHCKVEQVIDLEDNEKYFY